jgi:hypothetical protein
MWMKVALAGVLASVMAFAQGRGGGGMGEEMGGGRDTDRAGGMSEMGGMMPRRASKAELFADKLKLSREQREEAQRIVSAAMERAVAVRVEMDDRRAKIAGAIIDGRTAEEIRKLTADFAASSAQLARIEADTFGKIWASLKPNQQQKAEQAFELLAGMFTPPAGRGRGAAR